MGSIREFDMVHPSMKIYLNVLLLIFLQLSNGFEYTFMDDKAENQLYDENENKIDDRKFNKRIEKLTVPNEAFKRNFRTSTRSQSSPIYRTNNRAHCSCEMNFQQVDLGREYYPRYVQTGICQSNSCDKFYQCIEKVYKIKVLRKREAKDGEETLSSGLPKPLRDFWVAETVPVGVSCECVLDLQSFPDGV
ncbi:uncharacterized protein [Diabrotica undecimpunctata]|uniref:uncharacterized protein n=1 Tax=Diabrotica undecimpunctata TaxID=50387 RepID=UPI003B63FD6F